MRYRNYSFGDVRLQISSEFPDSSIQTMWQQCALDSDERVCRWRPSEADALELFVKIYRRRSSHGFLKRIQSSRAIREGKGYLEFQQRGIETVPLMAWGEERQWGLWQRGIVVTKAINARTVEEEFATTGDLPLLIETCQQLCAIHSQGLTHGDPLARNFLATKPHPTPFDLPSWGQMTPSSHKKDLIRFLGSMLQLTENYEIMSDLLSRYTERIDNLPQSEEDLLQQAQIYARGKKQA